MIWSRIYQTVVMSKYIKSCLRLREGLLKKHKSLPTRKVLKCQLWQKNSKDDLPNKSLECTNSGTKLLNYRIWFKTSLKTLIYATSKYFHFTNSPKKIYRINLTDKRAKLQNSKSYLISNMTEWTPSLK